MYFFCAVSFFFAVYAHEDHKHGISDIEHFQQGGHNANYDHDAFLGKSHGHDFDSLEPNEAKMRLKLMLNEVDKTRKHDWIKVHTKLVCFSYSKRIV